MDTLGFKDENVEVYKQRLREHNLNGRALVYSDNNEIKEALRMSLGEWTVFCMYFLGVLPQQSLLSSAASSVPLYIRQEPQMNKFVSRENVARGNRLSLNISKEDLQEKR